jgi:RHS repeat-associated protein
VQLLEKSQKSDVPPIRRQTSVPVRHQYIFVDFQRTSCYNIATTPATHYANSYYSAADTGLYYLQSRYYDPAIGRFINADSLVSTGQGILGNNMFAYCLNNPILFIDDSGYLAYPGEIHNEVVRRIARKYGYYSEQRIAYSPLQQVVYKRLYGRADLISSSGEVWEVKPNRMWHIEAGKKQIKQYVSGTWKNNSDRPLKAGGKIERDSFIYTSMGVTYRVTYEYAGNGIITYDYSIVDVNINTNILTAFAVICAGAGAFSERLTLQPNIKAAQKINFG